MIDDADIAELVKYAELLTVSAGDAVDIVCAAIRKLERGDDGCDTSNRRLMLFRWVTEAALKRRDPIDRLIH
ncbi:MAG TPA: hypothetical protein VEA16_12760 [Vicinamibacterales bacterium]|nr:hypothetical protein [Vicinamibacterales bacterium]